MHKKTKFWRILVVVVKWRHRANGLLSESNSADSDWPVLTGLGPVAQRLVSANRWLRGIKTYRFPWYLTLVSANHASSNPGQTVTVVMRGLLLIKTIQPDPSNPKYYARRRLEKPISLSKLLFQPWFGRPVLTLGKRPKSLRRRLVLTRS